VRGCLKVVIWLVALTIVLDVCWPQSARNRAAAGIAHSICSQNPAPEECGLDGHPWDPIKRLLTGGQP
jgi:hypothetical protein